ncbi:MAG: hypothetical protein WKF37_10240 [Bryobacteraceae bacterium]
MSRQQREHWRAPAIRGLVSKDNQYYSGRAEQERRLAKTSANRDVAAIHEELARLYEGLVEYPELRGKLRLVT